MKVKDLKDEDVGKEINIIDFVHAIDCNSLQYIKSYLNRNLCKDDVFRFDKKIIGENRIRVSEMMTGVGYIFHISFETVIEFVEDSLQDSEEMLPVVQKPKKKRGWLNII